METVRGRVLDIVFSTEDTGYAVIRIFTDKAEAYVLTGTIYVCTYFRAPCTVPLVHMSFYCGTILF